MASSARIDGSLPGSGAASTGLVFSQGWAVQYDWAADGVVTGHPKRLSSLGFPPGFDGTIEGVLRGQGAFSGLLYIFANGQYMRLNESTMSVDGGPLSTAAEWDLPTEWITLDAVLPGAGAKSGFAYFFHGPDYSRFDWATNRRSPGYPKKIASEWHTSAPFDRDIDGVIVGQAGFGTKAYLFKIVPLRVDDNGNLVSSGGRLVQTPVYARYDFNTEQTEFTQQDPVQVVGLWNGLFPLLDAGASVDVAATWLTAASAGLAPALTSGGAVPPAVVSGLSTQFRVTLPDPVHVTVISTLTAQILARLQAIPSQFRWTPGLSVAAQTIPGVSTEVGDGFSISHGPNGRAAVQIHEAVHFVFTGGLAIDVPEWSGETINGVAFGTDALSGRTYASLTADEASANPSSYAAFAQQAATGADSRFGGGRPEE